MPITFSSRTGVGASGTELDAAVVQYDPATGNFVLGNGDSISVPSGWGITLGTPVASTSGASIDFTGIPAGTKRVTLSMAEVSTNGTSQMLLQVGDGAIIATGYKCTGSNFVSSVVGSQSYTNGFGIRNGGAAVNYGGDIVFNLLDSTNHIWEASGKFYGDDTSNFITAGRIVLVSALDRVRLTTQNGTDTFDAGTVNISYE